MSSDECGPRSQFKIQRSQSWSIATRRWTPNADFRNAASRHRAPAPKTWTVSRDGWTSTHSRWQEISHRWKPAPARCVNIPPIWTPALTRWTEIRPGWTASPKCWKRAALRWMASLRRGGGWDKGGRRAGEPRHDPRAEGPSRIIPIRVQDETNAPNEHPTSNERIVQTPTRSVDWMVGVESFSSIQNSSFQTRPTPRDGCEHSSFLIPGPTRRRQVGLRRGCHPGRSCARVSDHGLVPAFRNSPVQAMTTRGNSRVLKLQMGRNL